MNSMIQTIDLTKKFGDFTANDHINLDVKEQEIKCIVGENGTGKSTLIKTLLHLQDAISGEVMAGDGLKAYEVGYLPQQTVVQKDFPATVEEIVLSGTLAKCGWRPFYSKVEKRMAEEKMKLSDALNQKFGIVLDEIDEYMQSVLQENLTYCEKKSVQYGKEFLEILGEILKEL